MKENKEETKLQSEQKTVRHYRKKPVVIEAIRWTGCMRSFEELKQFCPGIVDGGAVWHPYAPSEEPNTSSWPLFIHTLEGTMAAKIGDYIIKGVNGEFYPCDPDIFEKTYEAASQFKSQLPIEQKLVSQLLEIRDCLVAGDMDEAYHVLCKLADPDLTNRNHWEKWEDAARPYYINKNIKKVSEVDLKAALKEVNEKNRQIRESYRLDAEAMNFRAGQSQPLPIEEVERELPLNFWKRLEMFVQEVQVNDPMSEGEKEMILRIARKNL